MPFPYSLFGTVRQLPLEDERGWGSTVRRVLVDLIDFANAFGIPLGGVLLPRTEATTSSPAAGATLTATHPVLQVASPGGAVVLDATTAIADGAADGQLLTLMGTSDVDTVEVPDGANTEIQGPCILTDGDALSLRWDATFSVWQELSRNN